MTQALFAPWRMEYIQKVSDGPKECFFCRGSRETDKDELHLVLLRGAHSMLMLNKFPYVNGHLLVAPYRHAATLEECEKEARAEMMELLVVGQKALSRAMNPQGFNVGMNIGQMAGAGVPGHVHAHVVPRWNGDVNFMTVVGNVRIIPQSVEMAYKLLKEAVGKL